MRVRRLEDLEAPDFDGRPFTIGEPTDAWRSRSSGWALTVTFLLGVVGIYTWRAGSSIGAVVLFSLTAAAFGLSCVLIRMELRHYMEYRRRL